MEYATTTGPVLMDSVPLTSTEASTDYSSYTTLETTSSNVPSTYPTTANPTVEIKYPEVTSIATKSFTTSPCNENSPETLYPWSRNETSLSIFWFPSKTKFTHYIVSIEPAGLVEPIQIVKKKNIKLFDKVNVVFTGLHSSKLYNISLKKAYGTTILSETYMNWTTPPAQPLNLHVDESSITSRSFRIFWDAEKLSPGADYYKLSVKTDDELYFYTTLEGDDEKSYTFGNFRSDKNYIIELTTVFNDELSNPAVTSVYLPRKNNKAKARSPRSTSTTESDWMPSASDYFTPAEDDTAPEKGTSRNINNNTNINIYGKKK